jgi:hydrogenase/urease accessory protein HupE
MRGLASRRARGLLATVVLTFLSVPVAAHPLAPVVLTVREDGSGLLRAAWMFSRATGGADPSSLALVADPRCRNASAAVTVSAPGRITRIERYQCVPSDDAVLRLEIDGLAASGATLALRLLDAAGAATTRLYSGEDPILEIAPRSSEPLGLRHYLRLGFDHVLTGADHIAFIIALYLLHFGELRRLVVLVTAFTLAHSVTLALTVLDVLTLPARPIEVLIALSVAMLAARVAGEHGNRSDTIPRLWPMVFAFGLLHGLGFAGALIDLGLPRVERVPALLAFNLGIECGQLSVLAGCAALFGALKAVRFEGSALRPICGTLIGIAAGYWLVERIATYV